MPWLYESFDEIDDRTRTALDGVVKPGEVELAIRCLDAVAFQERWGSRIVLTADRLVVIKPGLLRATTETILLENVSRVGVDAHFLEHYLTIVGPEFERRYQVMEESGWRFAAAVRERLDQL